MSRRILVIEDEAPILAGVIDLLRAKGYEVVTAVNGHEGLAKARAAFPDLVLLDVMLPGLDGFEVLGRLRAEGLCTPVIMLTARGSEVDRVLGFQLGVDDYVIKPFSMLELLGRVEAVLRRCQAPIAPVLDRLLLGDAEVDFCALEVRKKGQVVDLPGRAFDLLRVLALAPGQVVSRDRLIDGVWGAGQVLNPRTIDNLVVKIRQAIEDDPEHPVILLSVPRTGYRLRTK